MKKENLLSPKLHWKSVRQWLPLAAALALPGLAGAQVTNWVAYNDHTRGTGTGPNVSTYTITTADTTTGGPLTNFLSGSLIEPDQVGVTISHNGHLGGYNGSSTAPNAGTPADQIFAGKIDWVASAFYFGQSPYTAHYTITFTNLTPGKQYAFRGSAVRGNSYAGRWTMATLAGASSAKPAHIPGTGSPASPGIVTNGWSPFGDNLQPGLQAAWNAGENRCGDVIGWDEIVPTGTSFSVICSNYQIATTTYPAVGGGTTAAGNTYSYAFGAFMLAEVDFVITPLTLVREPVGTNGVVRFRPFSLSVGVAGSSPQYQWYKKETGGDVAIPGATRSVYAVAQAQLSDTGDYYVTATNPSNTVTSATVHVEVIEDTVAPTIVSATMHPNFRDITVQFSEIMDTNNFIDTIDIQTDPEINGFFETYRWTNNGTVLVLSLRDPAVPGATYTLSLSAAVRDLAGNAVAPPDVPFTGWVPNTLGGVVFEVYTNLSTTDNSIGQLTNNAQFPNGPGATFTLTNLNTRDAYPDDTHEGYGGRMRSLFIPMVSGNYNLFIRSDDYSELWFNPAGPDPAGRILACREPGCCNAFLEPGVAQTSAAFPLVAGQGYYIEALFKEGTGGDFCQVAARLQGDTTPAASLTPLGGNYVGFEFVPPGLVGPLTIAQQPANAQVEQPAPATFTVAASATPVGPFVYQWQRSDDGGATFADVAGGAGPSYTTPPTTVGNDSGDQYRVIVKSVNGVLTSATATLTVVPDVTPPRVLSAVGGRATNTTILVTFSEPMSAGTAEDTANYEVIGPGGLAVAGAMVTNGNQVVLTLSSPRTPNAAYSLQVTSLDDLGSPANRIDPDPTVVPVRMIIELLGINSPSWKYLHQTVLDAPPCLDGQPWTMPAFDDSSWATGAGIFYANRTNSANQPAPNPAALPLVLDAADPAHTGVLTVLNLFTNAGNTNQALTWYFRTTFDYPAETNGATLMVRTIVDDGAVFYLNGARLFDVRLTNNPASCTNFSNSGGNQGWEPAITNNTAPRVLALDSLLNGPNTLAVEVHQSDMASSDLTLGVLLEAEVPTLSAGRPKLNHTFDSVAKTLTLEWTDSSFVLKSAASLSGPWNTVGTGASPQTVSTAAGTTFYRLEK
ncbi:MAG: Ig-like domain-containing protein [Verrucomicrobia bacterium]|nr:Ig-like domain-containing protein [Verrucomicrobiota bacterium]